MINPFTHLFRARDKPGKRLPQNAVSAAPSFYFGTSVSGKSVTARSAIQLSTVYACVRVIAETVASLPLNVFETTDKGGVKALQHPLQHLRNKLGTAGCLGTAAHPVADRADRRLTIAEHRAGITGNLRIFF